MFDFKKEDSGNMDALFVNDNNENASVETYDVAFFHELCNREKVNLRFPYKKPLKQITVSKTDSGTQKENDDYPPGF